MSYGDGRIRRWPASDFFQADRDIPAPTDWRPVYWASCKTLAPRPEWPLICSDTDHIV